MIVPVILQKSARILSSALLFAFLGGLFPVFAEEAAVPVQQVEPLDGPTGNSRDLEGLEERKAGEWPWGVGGEYDSPPDESPYQIRNGSQLPLEEGERDSLYIIQGGVKRPGATYPFAEF